MGAWTAPGMANIPGSKRFAPRPLKLLLLCFGFSDQWVGVTVNELPASAFAAEEFGNAQVERYCTWLTV
jgi:hypothetical protein